LRKSAILFTAIALLALCSLASAQQGDAYIGGGTLLSSSPSSSAIILGNCTANSSGNLICPEKGGTYLNLGADVIFKSRLGAAFDVNWKAGQGNFAGLGLPYRPLLFTFNGVFQPRLGKKAGIDLFGGVGWQTTRLYQYQNNFNCNVYGACYSSANHFLVDVGGGIRYYFWGHMFIRPEARLFHVLNNSDTSGNGIGFTSGNIIRVGASIGYTIGPE